MGEQVEKIGGSIAKSIDNADIVVTLSDRVELKLKEDVLQVPQSVFAGILPKAASERAVPVKKFTGDSGSLWKLLSVRDYSSVQQGIELASSLPEQIDDLIDDLNFILDNCTLKAPVYVECIKQLERLSDEGIIDSDDKDYAISQLYS